MHERGTLTLSGVCDLPRLCIPSNPSPNRAHGPTRYGGEKEAGKRTRTVVRGCIYCVRTYYLTSFVLKNLPIIVFIHPLEYESR